MSWFKTEEKWGEDIECPNAGFYNKTYRVVRCNGDGIQLKLYTIDHVITIIIKELSDEKNINIRE